MSIRFEISQVVGCDSRATVHVRVSSDDGFNSRDGFVKVLLLQLVVTDVLTLHAPGDAVIGNPI